MMLLEKCKKDPVVLGIANWFEATQQDLKFDSENIEIKNSENKGRYVVAKKTFKSGNKILEIDDPILLTVNQDSIERVCSNCMREPAKG